MFLCYLLLLLFSHVSSEHQSILSNVRFLQTPDFEECKENLVMSDQNDDGEVSRDEWATFISLQMKGRVEFASFEDLPISYVSIFTSTSCECLETQESWCCLADNAHIDLLGINNDQRQLHFFKTCTLVQQIMFFEEENFVMCKDNLQFVDNDGDEKLSGKEWANFISLQSNGIISVNEFRDLPLGLIGLFNTISCYCLDSEGFDSSCCLRDNANINLDLIDSNQRQPYFFEICEKTNQILGLHLQTTTPPTIAPEVITASPSSFAHNFETFALNFTYGIVVDGAFSAEDILLGNNNTISRDLIHATTEIVIQILNTTYPCVPNIPLHTTNSNDFENEVDNSIFSSTKANPHLQSKSRMSTFLQPSSKDAVKISHLRKSFQNEIFIPMDECRVYYTDLLPVKIVEIINDECNSDSFGPTDACMLVRSKLTIVINNAVGQIEEIKKNISRGLTLSFIDGSFFDALP